jgi:hypothetical protein
VVSCQIVLDCSECAVLFGKKCADVFLCHSGAHYEMGALTPELGVSFRKAGLVPSRSNAVRARQWLPTPRG